ncbi:DUF2284 domain-containing protein [Alkalibaculum sp. M08DMB]|uniref:DUF2284 domain-containing protein n=1 Tax=Alkalibaculum sporogenes TaxID=2655001 RepID=A0A6A7KBP3_9FIRM|nr:DUF2284 domain-containing protein [Alkalibaculum sporogenes]MPW26691.1 DUF2284 domain-containing protein [Alkalibaculum sporogenes]
MKNRLIEVFKEIGFDEYKEIKISDIIFSNDVFNQCSRNICGNYGKSHTCKGGSVEESKERVSKFQNGFLINKIVPIRTRKEMMDSIELVATSIKALRRSFENDPIMVMGAGPCTVCESCTALLGKPCLFPDKIQYSMEGSGIDVVRMSMKEKMTYNGGEKGVGYFTLVLYN